MVAHAVTEPDGRVAAPHPSVATDGRSPDVRASTVTLDQRPVHPIAVMQGAFEESIVESMEKPNTSALARGKDEADPKARRQRLLEEDDYNPSYNAQWRRKPGAKYHPLWKVLAQIAFGVHLLHQRLAKSDEEVVNILQGHVDEVDTFLERATEDFDLALADIKERIDYLKLPLEHVNIFDLMLGDKKFRMSILEGNEKIEKIIDRTARAMNDSLVDVSKGLEATAELERHLNRIGIGWAQGNAELAAIYNAMRGNTEGWYGCFRGLQMKGNSLGVSLVQLGGILNEMSKRAGAASRRSILAGRADNGRSSPRVASPPPVSRFATSPVPADKPLPQDPGMIPPSLRVTFSPRAMSPQENAQVDRRYENPRQQPKPPVRPPSVAELPAESVVSRQSSRASRRPDKNRAGSHRSMSSQQTSAVVPIRLEGGMSPTSPAPPSRQHSKRRNREQIPSPTTNDSAYSSGSDRAVASTEMSPTDPSSKAARLLGLTGNADDGRYHRNASSPDVAKGKPARVLGFFPNSSSTSQSALQPEHGVLRDARQLSTPSPAPGSVRSGASSRGSLRRQASLSSLRKMFSWRRSSQKQRARPLSGVLEAQEPAGS